MRSDRPHPDHILAEHVEEHLPVALTADHLERRIFVMRDVKVMFDRDLARLYGVSTKVLNQAVRRNIERFPPDFAFQLTAEETYEWKSQIVTSNSDRMGLRKSPWVFTEHGVAMLSSVLRSDRAIQVNVAIMRAFGRLRESVSLYATLVHRIDELEHRYDGKFTRVFDAIRELMQMPGTPSATPLMNTSYSIAQNQLHTKDARTDIKNPQNVDNSSLEVTICDFQFQPH